MQRQVREPWLDVQFFEQRTRRLDALGFRLPEVDVDARVADLGGEAREVGHGICRVSEPFSETNIPSAAAAGRARNKRAGADRAFHEGPSAESAEPVQLVSHECS